MEIKEKGEYLNKSISIMLIFLHLTCLPAGRHLCIGAAFASEYRLAPNDTLEVVYLTPRPIYVIQHDLKKNTWDVKEAKSVDEAKALAGRDYASEIKHGDIVSVEVSQKPDWWENNWYKVITGVAVLVGIYATLHK